MADQARKKVRVPWFQPLSVVRGALKVYDGVAKNLIDTMNKTLNAQSGTVKNQMDWTDPDAWIDERLTGDLAALAWRFWKESGHVVNPRWVDGPNFLIRVYKLSSVDEHGLCRLTDLGRAFLAEDPEAVRHIDEGEGMLTILSILSAKSKSKLSGMLDEWTEYVRANSGFRAESLVYDSLRRRLADLKDRKLIARDGHTYSITQAGLDYLGGGPRPDPKQAALRAVKAFNDGQRDILRERLAAMDPTRFEELVGELLSAMGYEDVQVTKEAGDKGVDVVATVQFGITTVTEVVQVKRYQGNINRQILDQLRGALPYHNALRGTIITTGGFSGGCKDAALYPGAAPIGLIDGEHLLDLLFEHRIGIQEWPARLYEVDEPFFEQTGESSTSTNGDESD